MEPGVAAGHWVRNCRVEEVEGGKTLILGGAWAPQQSDHPPQEQRGAAQPRASSLCPGASSIDPRPQ